MLIVCLILLTQNISLLGMKWSRIIISHRLYRNDCLMINGNYVKDLNILNRDLVRNDCCYEK